MPFNKKAMFDAKFTQTIFTATMTPTNEFDQPAVNESTAAAPDR